jgi:hypothetical protein
MGTQVEGWNTGKVFAKRLARREGPFIEIYMTEAEFKTFGGDAVVRIEDDSTETMMTLAEAITNLQNRTEYDAEIVFKSHWS